MDNQIKKLVYRSKNRGCKEMDIVLGKFATNAINSLNSDEYDLYAKLLDEPDNDIWDWVSERSETPVEYKNLIKKIANAQ